MMSEALGLWNIGEGIYHERMDSTTAKRIIKAAYRSGIKTFDSAYSYTDADSILYSALKEIRAERKDWRIIEKIMPTPTFSRKAERILGRLHTSYIDILLIHWPGEESALYSSLKALEDLKEKGIAEEIGVSNFPIDLLKKAADDFPITYHERPLSLIWKRDWEEEKSLALKELIYAPLGLGGLTEKKKEKLSPLFFYSSPEFDALKIKLKNLAQKYNSTLEAVAFSWVLAQGPYMIIRGASSERQLKIPHLKLEEEDIKALSRDAEKITALNLSDNIFSHNWKGREYEKTHI